VRWIWAEEHTDIPRAKIKKDLTDIFIKKMDEAIKRGRQSDDLEKKA
jgi:hypothetical protein